MSAREKLENLKTTGSLLGMYNEAMVRLRDSGVLDVLRERGRVLPISTSTSNYVDVQAAAANQSIGYNQALDDLYYFRETFLTPRIQEQARADFGALARAVAKGDMTQEESDAIRHNNPIPTGS